MISLYLQFFLLTGGGYCSEACYCFIVPARSKYQTRCYFCCFAAGSYPALLLDLLPCHFPYTCTNDLISFILPLSPLSSLRSLSFCCSSAVVLITGAESKKIFLAALHLWPNMYLGDGGRVAKVAAAGRKYRSWNRGREKRGDIVERQW